MQEDKEVKIFIGTTLAGPCVKDGWYSAMLEYQTKKGPATVWFVGMEEKTTYYRSVLLAAIKALGRLKPCRAVICTGCRYIAGIYEQGTLEGWSRAEWKRPTGETVKNKDLWQQFLDEVSRLGGKEKITFQFSKHHDYQDFLLEKMQEKRKEQENSREKKDEKCQKR